MNNLWLKKVLPHVLAILVFLVVAVLFCKPVLDGKTLNQHDTGIEGWRGSAQNAFDVKEKTGTMPLWSTTVFSGMPNYQIAMEGKSALPVDLNKVFGLGLPKPMNFFFIACVCFYILCVVLRFNPVTGILGGLAFAYSTYNPLIVSAGHETKMMTIAYMPFLLAGLLLIFNKRYWIGLAVATLGATLVLMANHPQIAYYFFMIAGAVTIGYVVVWIRNKDFKHLAISFGLSAVAALVGLGCYSLAFLTTKEYKEYTMRGGKSVEIKGNEVKAVNTKGLDPDYAMSYSMSMIEPIIMFMPKAVGGSSGTTLKEDSKVIEKLAAAGVPEMQAAQFASQFPAYWGGMVSPEYSGGPAYIGAVIFILAIIGFVIVKNQLKWPLLIISVLAIMMSWGKYFFGFNEILLNSLPLYNSFRAPSMALVICQLTLPLMAVITVYSLFFEKNSGDFLKENFKKILYTLGGITAVLALLYIGQGYSSAIDEQIIQMQIDPNGGDTLNRAIIAGMKADRQSLFGAQVMRAVLFMALVLGAVYAVLKNMIRPAVAVAVLAAISIIDLWVVDKQYFSDDHYVAKDEIANQIEAPTAIDQEIFKDKDPHFRVFDVAGMDKNRVSYFHRSALGYSAVKLRVYQDIIERYFAGAPNEQILNALDVRYIITRDESGQERLVPNPNAYGAAWFVKAVKPVATEVEELQAIGSTNLKDTAIVPQSALKSGSNLTADSTSSVALIKYTNDEIEYNASSATGGFVVLSEVYYPAGWNAYIDGKQTDIVKTNYFMRGLVVPQGKHTIKLVFEPETVKRGMSISYLSSWLLIILVLGGFFMQWWVDKKKAAHGV
ncbi:YfhO family protein [Niabella yanshanensis]|uniref:YfhO family protein n=1 Tax=Niabella yanshanensis TaxID=577386 RepID=A0ABZ0W5G6_9BACT|nr:YfhO family protein [Niabella yanshanensis]WQD37331.1 YfhO family protein [Niabella yanshanensis]